MNLVKRFIAPLLLIAGGILFIVFGFRTVKEMKDFPQTDAVVSHLTREWVPDGEGYETEQITVYVTYTVDGKEYTEALQNGKTNYEQGDAIKVYYDPADPTYVSGASKSGATIQLAFGSVIALGGLGGLVAALVRRR
ncbi:MAG: DUF3592 domain-containing protein [Clostridia bacterium]|nr:DUF3592 domain-containing protein [Clostridia bacterium]